VVAGPASVAGHLTIPENPKGIVVFAHGSGSSRHSPRNRYVAQILNAAGLATLLFDLLAPDEERNRANAFAIELLAARLQASRAVSEEVPQVSPRPLLPSVPLGLRRNSHPPRQ
jgi:hypothetical protein